MVTWEKVRGREKKTTVDPEMPDVEIAWRRKRRKKGKGEKVAEDAEAEGKKEKKKKTHGQMLMECQVLKGG